MDTETTEARYLRASRTAHRAWLVTQPQFVIPGLLDALDAAPQSVGTSRPQYEEGCPVSTSPRAGGSFERVPLNDGGEPRHDKIPPEVTPHSSGAEPRHPSCPAPASVSTAGSVAASTDRTGPTAGRTAREGSTPSGSIIHTTRTAPSSAQGLRGRPQKGA